MAQVRIDEANRAGRFRSKYLPGSRTKRCRSAPGIQSAENHNSRAGLRFEEEGMYELFLFESANRQQIGGPLLRHQTCLLGGRFMQYWGSQNVGTQAGVR